MTPTRRSFLASGVGLAGTALAGCLGGGGDSQDETTTTTGSVPVPEDSPVSDIEVTATDVVVSLEPDTDVSQLNLIAPDGTAFARRTVTAGATTVRIPIIEHGEATFWDTRYSAGTQDLVAVTGSGTTRIPIPLEPDVRIRSIEPTYDEVEHSPTGNIEVTLENIGTGPTWVYQITYEDAPNIFANAPLANRRDWPSLDSPSEIEDVILAAGETKSYIGESPPLDFRNLNGPNCTSEPIEFGMMIGLGLGEPFLLDLRVTPSGEPFHSRGLALCSNVSIEFDHQQEEKWD